MKSEEASAKLIMWFGKVPTFNETYDYIGHLLGCRPHMHMEAVKLARLYMEATGASRLDEYKVIVDMLDRELTKVMEEDTRYGEKEFGNFAYAPVSYGGVDCAWNDLELLKVELQRQQKLGVKNAS